ncbi:sigma-70 family RNA polymerase sigma factor [Botrimarina mediterranea]|uniref:ECF RNA polymerase sigma factor SigL n=1 Tax=Botrimarina mediterranea TaxID=2528022 RepID=A0A518KDW1_9BACT|nr:sigma-70 family RNA polymerase sigma factor [Botrimarina mediterranea]QDV75986.1 ECF RNA polymerase sigma factor SigL [Botrimarina mediterranea]QDV80581.1 ECF RNA polymerase sigma factor SigL [Planctomycetes bacterium K2D]
MDRDRRFVDLLTSHQRDLYAYVYALMAGDSSAPDVVQDANLDLWAHKEECDLERPFLPWALRFAFNRVLAYRKSRGRSRLVFSDEYVQTLSDALTEEPLSADQRLVALGNCLEHLGEDQRQLVRERYSVGSTVKGLAVRFGATPDQVSAKLYRIRKSLADCIERRLAGEGLR